ncbi:HTH-like domain-containing protein [Sphingomonas kaistensis]|uniref:HTH-like domain-containing protein n=1 Tax=Sphingomonas kaistensis TaxID=298708 RepID=UPI00143C104D
MKKEIFERIKRAVDRAPRNGYVAELHLQCLKHAHEFEGLSNREICDELGLASSWGTEIAKMRKILGRLEAAGLDVHLI